MCSKNASRNKAGSVDRAGITPAYAGGLWLYEEATPDMGVGGAGRQAAGFDASTASGNPAAMTGHTAGRVLLETACKFTLDIKQSRV
jgi:hypothetical protein